MNFLVHTFFLCFSGSVFSLTELSALRDPMSGVGIPEDRGAKVGQSVVVVHLPCSKGNGFTSIVPFTR